MEVQGGSVIYEKFENYKVEIMNPLGKGVFGEVFRCLPAKPLEGAPEKLVAKKIYLGEKSQDSEKETEKSILKCFKHPNIVKLYDSFSTKDHLFLILEFAQNGDLQKYVNKQPNQRLSENMTLRILAQIVSALDYAASKYKVIHRDLKLANILLDENNNVKIADFGFARFVENLKHKNKMTVAIGSIFYMAPEVFFGEPYNSKCDVWSIGIMTYELLYGCAPWKLELTDMLLFKKIKENNSIDFKKKDISEDLKDLIEKMLIFDVDKRFSLKHVKKHRALRPFFLDIFEIATYLQKIVNKMIIFLSQEYHLFEVPFRNLFYLLFFLNKLNVILINHYLAPEESAEKSNQILKEIINLIEKEEKDSHLIQNLKNFDFLEKEFKKGFNEACIGFLRKATEKKTDSDLQNVYEINKKNKKFLVLLFYMKNLKSLEKKSENEMKNEIKKLSQKSIKAIMEEDKIKLNKSKINKDHNGRRKIK